MNKSTSPKVSVCIPTYNYGHYLPEAIKSVLAQTFTDFELLVIDDCSADNTRETVRILMNSDSRIRFIQNEARLGFVGNFTRCIEAAIGEYIKILCADDVLEAACLEKMVNVLDANDHVALVSCSRVLVDRALKTTGLSAYASKYRLLRGPDAIKRCLFSGNLIGEPTAVLFRKRDSARGFNSGYQLLVDLEMWFHLLEKGDFAFLPEPLCKIRQHDGQATYDCIKTLSFIDDNDKLYREFIGKPYMGTLFVSALRMQLRMTLIIWMQRSVINNPDVTRRHIGHYMNYHLAMCIMPLYTALIKLTRIVRT